MVRRPIAKTLKYVEQISVEQVLTQCENGSIGIVEESKGRDVHVVRLSNGLSTLATLLPKLRGVVWLRKGSFVFVQILKSLDNQLDTKLKVNGEILHVFTTDQIHAVKMDLKDYSRYKEDICKLEESSNIPLVTQRDSNSSDELERNPNHRYSYSDSSDSSCSF